MNHRKKCWPQFFEAVATGVKTFEIRDEDDCHYEIGDVVTLVEFDPDTGQEGSEIELPPITYVVRGAPFLPEGKVVFSWTDTEHYP